MKDKINWDAIGISTSVACAIHCAILPLVLTSLPLLGINIIDNEAFEYGMIGLAFIVGCLTFVHGYRHHHHRLAPLVLFSFGILLLLAKQVWHAYHLVLLPFSVTGIVFAHMLNLRFGRSATMQPEESERDKIRETLPA